MIPYYKATGVGLIAWSPVSRGILCWPWSRPPTTREKTDNFLLRMIRACETKFDQAIVDRVEEIAKKHGVSMTCIATAWSIKKGNCPIIGLSSEERTDEASANAVYELSEQDQKDLKERYLPEAFQGH